MLKKREVAEERKLECSLLEIAGPIFISVSLSLRIRFILRKYFRVIRSKAPTQFSNPGLGELSWRNHKLKIFPSSETILLRFNAGTLKSVCITLSVDEENFHFFISLYYITWTHKRNPPVRLLFSCKAIKYMLIRSSVCTLQLKNNNRRPIVWRTFGTK